MKGQAKKFLSGKRKVTRMSRFPVDVLFSQNPFFMRPKKRLLRNVFLPFMCGVDVNFIWSNQVYKSGNQWTKFFFFQICRRYPRHRV